MKKHLSMAAALVLAAGLAFSSPESGTAAILETTVAPVQTDQAGATVGNTAPAPVGAGIGGGEDAQTASGSGVVNRQEGTAPAPVQAGMGEEGGGQAASGSGVVNRQEGTAVEAGTGGGEDAQMAGVTGVMNQPVASGQASQEQSGVVLETGGEGLGRPGGGLPQGAAPQAQGSGQAGMNQRIQTGTAPGQGQSGTAPQAPGPGRANTNQQRTLSQPEQRLNQGQYGVAPRFQSGQRRGWVGPGGNLNGTGWRRKTTPGSR